MRRRAVLKKDKEIVQGDNDEQVRSLPVEAQSLAAVLLLQLFLLLLAIQHRQVPSHKETKSGCVGRLVHKKFPRQINIFVSPPIPGPRGRHVISRLCKGCILL